MMRGDRSVTVVLQQDGATKSRTFRIRLWTLKLVAGVVGAAAIGFVLIAALYGPIVRAAARVPGLERDIARLRADNAKILELSAALDSVERRYAQMRQMIGADIVPDPVTLASTLPVAPPIRARVTSSAASVAVVPISGSTVPRQWPLDDSGFITRGQVGTGGGDEAHPGIDVAVPVGSLVRASGGGTVRQVGDDPEYGFFVLLDHPNDYQTMYGHLSRILVASSAIVAPGEVIGLSGNTGRSTAPHLHFEIRQRALSLDPLTLVKEGR